MRTEIWVTSYEGYLEAFLEAWSKSNPEIQQISLENQVVKSGAGWSSLAARRAHNPKVVGSNPTPATNSLVII